MREILGFLGILGLLGILLFVPLSLIPVFILSLLIALSVHEWAHAMMATKLGDPTARNAGRLTLNPLAHLDAMGTFVFIITRFQFAWAKPVPVNPSYFRNPRRDVCLVALAGPLSNLCLALIAYVALALLQNVASSNVTVIFLQQFFDVSLVLNLSLMAFNLIPIAPLDGSKIVEAFVPLRHSDRYDEIMRMGPYILLGLLIAEHLLNLPLLSFLIRNMIYGVLWTMDAVIGRLLG